jgi:hypothetical protein
MKTEKVTVERAEAELMDVIRNCDGETLAAIYEQFFGVEKAEWVDEEVDGHILVTYKDGCGHAGCAVMEHPDTTILRLRELLSDVANSYEDSGCEGCGTVDAGVMNRVRQGLGWAPLEGTEFEADHG